MGDDGLEDQRRVLRADLRHVVVRDGRAHVDRLEEDARDAEVGIRMADLRSVAEHRVDAVDGVVGRIDRDHEVLYGAHDLGNLIVDGRTAVEDDVVVEAVEAPG